METYLVTGANRGIGLELCAQLLASGNAVVAVYRTRSAGLDSLRADYEDRLRLLEADVSDERGVRMIADSLSGVAVDFLVHNAGIFPDRNKSLQELDRDMWLQVMATNSIAPVLLTAALLPNLERGDRKCVIALSSDLGSISKTRDGGYYMYRTSKAALNSGFRTLAYDLAAKRITVACVHPGWVRTDMGGTEAPLAATDSVKSLLRLFDSASFEMSGRFVDLQGKEIAW